MICLEPTDNTLQLGCLGNINARVVFDGRLGALGPAVARRERDQARARGAPPASSTLEPLDVDVDGLVFREVVSVTQIDDCGNATNVDPGPRRGDAQLPLRARPHARARPRRACASSSAASSRSRQARRAAPVAIRSPLVGGSARPGGLDVEPKQAWTNVADFAARGLDALNFGPGATRYAHTADERVEIAELRAHLRRAPAFLAR